VSVSVSVRSGPVTQTSLDVKC